MIVSLSINLALCFKGNMFIIAAEPVRFSRRTLLHGVSNHMFNSFLCTFLNTFQASFSVKHNSLKDKNDRITHGKKISCKHKRGLYAFNTNTINPKAKVHYIKYCKMLRKIITEAKKPHYSRLIGKK